MRFVAPICALALLAVPLLPAAVAAKSGSVEVELMCPVIEVRAGDSSGSAAGELTLVVGRGRDHRLAAGSRGNVWTGAFQKRGSRGSWRKTGQESSGR